MRTTLTLDDDVFEAVQSLARASGKNLGKVLSQVARRGLTASAKATKRSGLPVFRVPEDAGIIPSTRASEILADEMG